MEGVPDSYNLCEILVAIVFGLENPTYWAKSDKQSPKWESQFFIQDDEIKNTEVDW